MDRTYRLPDGHYTNSVNIYTQAYQELADPLVKLTDMQIIAYDPDIVLSDGRNIITLPLWFIKLLSEELTK